MPPSTLPLPLHPAEHHAISLLVPILSGPKDEMTPADNSVNSDVESVLITNTVKPANTSITLAVPKTLPSNAQQKVGLDSPPLDIEGTAGSVCHQVYCCVWQFWWVPIIALCLLLLQCRIAV